MEAPSLSEVRVNLPGASAPAKLPAGMVAGNRSGRRVDDYEPGGRSPRCVRCRSARGHAGRNGGAGVSPGGSKIAEIKYLHGLTPAPPAAGGFLG